VRRSSIVELVVVTHAFCFLPSTCARPSKNLPIGGCEDDYFDESGRIQSFLVLSSLDLLDSELQSVQVTLGVIAVDSDHE
jgi:hypothetical protein